MAWPMRKTREGWGHALVELGKRDPRTVVLVGDLSESTMVHFFAHEFPDRFFQCGIAEQNMMCIAAGLAATGKIPYLATYGAFAAFRAADQIRVTVCYSNLPVRIGGAHGGISVGQDGATHQVMEEMAYMRALPNMTLIVPADYWETKKATIAAHDLAGPAYIRFGREDVPTVTDENTPFVIGKGQVMRDGGDVTLVACGIMVAEALDAAAELATQGIDARVINMATLKPLDHALLEKAARETGAIVTAEEHQVHGGLAGAVSESIVRSYPVPMEFVATMDRFGQSGKPRELMEAFGLTSKEIIAAAHKVVARKAKAGSAA